MRAVVFDQCTQKFTLMLWRQRGARSSSFALMQCHQFSYTTHADNILLTTWHRSYENGRGRTGMYSMSPSSSEFLSFLPPCFGQFLVLHLMSCWALTLLKVRPLPFFLHKESPLQTELKKSRSSETFFSMDKLTNYVGHWVEKNLPKENLNLKRDYQPFYSPNDAHWFPMPEEQMSIWKRSAQLIHDGTRIPNQHVMTDFATPR